MAQSKMEIEFKVNANPMRLSLVKAFLSVSDALDVVGPSLGIIETKKQNAIRSIYLTIRDELEKEKPSESKYQIMSNNLDLIHAMTDEQIESMPVFIHGDERITTPMVNHG